MSHSPSPFVAAVRKLTGQTGFVVAFVVLLTAALTLNAATSYLKLFFKKLPIQPARKIDSVPLTLGGSADKPNWICVSRDEALPADIAETLGTEQFVFRDYLNASTDELKAAAQRLLQKKTDKEQKIALQEVRERHPEAVINFAVTYYTGKADTVPHIPDRCYVADGYEPSQWETQRWPVKTPIAPESVDVRFITFEDQAGNGQVTRNVAYFFNCNGEYTSDPTQVRLKLQNLFEKYGYFAKVEIMTQTKDRQKAAESMKAFLVDALPEVEKTLPDWNKRGR